MPESTIAREIAFDRFVLHADTRQLLVAGEPAKLGARAFDLLLALAERRDRVVGKNELLEVVWPGLIVEENNLQVQISSLRKALGSEAIATVPGRGYRLCAPVVRGGEQLASDTPIVPVVERPPTLLGRENDLARLRSLIQANSLVTIAGAGGVGKTSVARAIARDWRDGREDAVAWVSLAPIADAAIVVPVVAGALGLQLPPDDPSLSALVKLLARRSLLIVLDNAEHLVDAAAELASALAHAAHGVKLLVTSRQPLQVATEVVYRLDGLRVPEPSDLVHQTLHAGAVALFAKRARDADLRFELGDSNVKQVIEICRQLDGLPLAIEMAAARVPSLGVSGVKALLGQHWRMLSTRDRTASPRHRTLQATLDWSHALLGPSEQRTLRRLAPFNGGFTLDAASEVTSEPGAEAWEIADALAGLIDKSMLVADANDPPRYRLLETVRAYALERLAASGELSGRLEKHARWCLNFFAAANDGWWVRPTESCVAEVLPEMDNLRAALGWSLGEGGNAPLAVSLAATSLPMWQRLCEESSPEARDLADRALARMTDKTEASVQARLHFARGLYYDCVDAPAALVSLHRAVELGERSLQHRDRAHVLLEYGRVLTRVGDFDAAERALVQARDACDGVDLPMLSGLVSLAWGFLYGFQGLRRAAREHFQHAVSMFDHAQAAHLAPRARNDLADCVWAEGDLVQAETLLRQVIDRSQRTTPALGDHSGIPQMNLAGVLAERGDAAGALSWARQAQPLMRRSEKTWSAYDVLSLIAVLRNRLEGAALLQGFSDAVYATAGLAVREPNEARIHAKVAKALFERLEAGAVTQALAQGALLDEEAAWRIALDD